jgi:hypothetical protein
MPPFSRWRFSETGESQSLPSPTIRWVTRRGGEDIAPDRPVEIIL